VQIAVPFEFSYNCKSMIDKAGSDDVDRNSPHLVADHEVAVGHLLVRKELIAGPQR
jgi:hypothetical protein